MRRGRRNPRRRADYRSRQYTRTIGVRRSYSRNNTLSILIFIAVLYLLFDVPIIILAVLTAVLSMISRKYRTNQRRQISRIIYTGAPETIHDISIRTGMPEDEVRRTILTAKRDNILDVQFDPITGEIKPSHETPLTEQYDYSNIPPEEKRYCEYCGFILKPEDRFCPYCGAPVKK